MTVSPEAPRLAFGDLAGAITALRRHGLRLSTSRRLVLETLFAAEGPISAEHIARGLKLDLASVYRNLETLERHGLLRHVHLGHGPGLYVLVGRGEQEFLHCEHCGAVRALAPAQLDPIRDLIRERFGYRARFTHFAIVGACEACAARDGHHASEVRSDAADQLERGDHDHAHSHGGYVHSHPQAHQRRAPGRHEHGH